MSVNPHQFPFEGEVFLDHAAIFVEEFDRSGEALERLGFTLTPFRAHASALKPGDPVTPLGTGNRCAMLREGFIEVLGPTADTPMARQLRAQLARHPGLHLIAFSGHDAPAHHAALEADGMQPLPLARIERTQASADGEHGIRASIVRLPPEAWPEGRVQMVFPAMPPEAMWHPSLVRHANHADRLSEMLVVVSHPDERATRFARFARRPLRREPGRKVLELDRGRLHVCGTDTLPALLPGIPAPGLPWIAAVAIGSSDLAATRTLFEHRGIAFREHGGTLQVPPAEALGASLVFHDFSDNRVFDRLAETAARQL